MKKKSPQNPRAYRVYKTAARRRRLWIVISLGLVGFLIIAAAAVAGSSYWWFTAKVSVANQRVDEEVKQALEEEPSTTLVPVEQFERSEEAYDMVILGGDTRGTGQTSEGRADTIIVIHVDPELDFASVLSVPRDLWVDIPGHSKNRINAAYSWGGTQLAIQTIKNTLGVNITKYVGVDFQSFQKVVDSLGGVYIDVDRRYDDTEPRPIDLQPGYQLLDGADALNFARYRFDQQYDWGRQVRQQRVLAALREQAVGWNLPRKLPGLVGSALDSVSTNLSATEILDLAYWVVKLDTGRIRQIQIKADSQTIGGRSVLVAQKEDLKNAVVQLLTPPEDASATTTATATSAPKAEVTPTSGGETSTASTVASTVTSLAKDPTTTTSVVFSESPANLKIWKTAQASVPFSLEAPRYLPTGFTYAYKAPTGKGTYQIDPGGDSKPAVRMLYQYKSGSLYLGISATTWLDAPLASRGSEVKRDGVTYTIVGTSGKVDRIWWKRDGVLYFVSNTLRYTVSRNDLLNVALSMVPVEAAD